jgi:hypothetical protein
VTNFTPPPSKSLRSSDAGNLMPSSTSDTSFSSATPASIEVKGVALDQDDLIEAQMPDDDYVDLSYYMGDYNVDGELGHEEHRLDLTNFDGDSDDRVRGESTLNRALKKEGTVRRAITRKKTESRRPKRFSGARVDPRPGRLPSLPTFSEEACQPQPSPPAQSLESPAAPSCDTLGRHHAAATKSSHLFIQSIDTPVPHTPSPNELDKSGYEDGYKEGSQHMKRMSTISIASQESSRQALIREVIDEPQLEFGEQEMRDISVMAEFARPGRPKLDMILRDEVGRAGGRIVVACE